jgi:L-seryl-tRNA(Ser) seleniumtransferase
MCATVKPNEPNTKKKRKTSGTLARGTSANHVASTTMKIVATIGQRTARRSDSFGRGSTIGRNKSSTRRSACGGAPGTRAAVEVAEAAEAGEQVEREPEVAEPEEPSEQEEAPADGHLGRPLIGAHAQRDAEDGRDEVDERIHSDGSRWRYPISPASARFSAIRAWRASPTISRGSCSRRARRERQRLKAGGAAAADLGATVADEVAARLERSLVPAINATGIPIHTNLGRAPLHPDAVRAVADVARGYAVVELERESGRRGGRLATIERALTALTGAEAALAVNNNAAASSWRSRARRGKEVVVSRGELVEIGGSFRVPDVIAAGGAILRDVGPRTGRASRTTSAPSVPRPRSSSSAPLELPHRGVHGAAERKALAELAHERGLVLVEDLGSGMIGPALPIADDEEPVARSLEDGVDLACFSGDKLLGGPQAGLAIGRESVVAKLRSHPLYRALRLDKLVLSALEATLLVYRRGGRARSRAPDDRPQRSGPRRSRGRRSRADSRERGRGRRRVLGGWRAPGTGLATRVVAIEVRDPEAFTRALRLSTPAIVARVHKGRVAIDPRCLLDGEADLVVRRVTELLDRETP